MSRLNFVKDLLSAVLFLLIIAITWSTLFVIMSPVLLPVFFISLFKKEATLFGKKVLFKSWATNMFISQDQTANTLLGGSMDTHISGRVGYWSLEGNGIALKMEVVIDFIFRVLFNQLNHCRVAIEQDESYNKHWGG